MVVPFDSTIQRYLMHIVCRIVDRQVQEESGATRPNVWLGLEMCLSMSLATVSNDNQERTVNAILVCNTVWDLGSIESNVMCLLSYFLCR